MTVFHFVLENMQFYYPSQKIAKKVKSDWNLFCLVENGQFYEWQKSFLKTFPKQTSNVFNIEIHYKRETSSSEFAQNVFF